MNKVYRNVWNENTQTWVAASELANSKTKSNTVCEQSIVKKIINKLGLKKIVSVTITALILEWQAIAPVYAANAAIVGGNNSGTVWPGGGYQYGGHGSMVFSGDDDHCGADRVNGRRTVTNGISATDEYLRFIRNTAFANGRPYGSVTSNKAEAWSDEGKTDGGTGYQAAPTGGDNNAMPVAYGIYSFAYGCGSYATGNYSTAFGANATATAGGAMAFGVASLASGAASIAFGISSQATGVSSVALGSMASSNGTGSVAVGLSSAANNDGAVALGTGANASGNSSVAVGNAAQAVGDQSISIGAGNQVSGRKSGAIGGVQSNAIFKDGEIIATPSNPTNITGNNTYSLGNENGTIAVDDSGVFGNKNTISGTTEGVNNIRIVGNNNTVSSAKDLVFGNDNTVSSAKDLVFGNDNTVTATRGLILGNDNTVNAARGLIIGNNTSSGANATDAIAIGNSVSVSNASGIAIGTSAKTIVDAGVALGSGSVADIEKGKTGFDPTGTNSAANNPTWTSTAGAVAIGNAGSGITRQLTGLAAGTNDTDAVNVAQMKNLASVTTTGLSSLSTAVSKVGDMSNVNSNISTLNSNVSALQSDALQWKNNVNGIGGFYDASHGTNQAQKITNVAAGQLADNSTDAVNAGQLYQVSTSSASGITSLSTAVSRVSDMANVNGNISTLSSSVADLKSDALQWKKNTDGSGAYDASHGTNQAQKITNVADGQLINGSTDAVNAGQLYQVSTSSASGITSLSTAALSTTGKLNTVSSNVSALQSDALQWKNNADGSGAYDASHGTNQAQKITNVAAGQLEDDSTDAVNASQLYQVSTSSASGITSLSTAALNTTGKLNTVSSNVSALQSDALQWKKNTDGSGAYDASHGTNQAQKITNVAAGQLENGSTDAVNAGQLYQLSTSSSTSFNSLSTIVSRVSDMTNVNGNISTLSSSVADLQSDALQWKNNVNGSGAYDASHGTNQAQKITNVAAGQLADNSTDAVNASQLYQVSTSSASGITSLSTVALSTTGKLNTVSNDVSALKSDALQWKSNVDGSGAYDASHGTNRAQKITNIAAGHIDEYSTEAVNAAQFYQLSTSSSTGLSTLSSTLNRAGDLTNVNSNISTLTTKVNDLVIDALQWHGNADGSGFYDASHGTNRAQRITNIAAGQVNEHSTDAVNAAQLYSLSTTTSTSLSNLNEAVATTGNIANISHNVNVLNDHVSTLLSGALQWKSNADGSGFYDASHATSSPQKISNVAAGVLDEHSTDAVNAAQLYSLSTITSTSLSNLNEAVATTGNISTVASNVYILNNQVSSLLSNALQWHENADGSGFYDASHGTSSPQKISNLAAGVLDEHSTDAVNAAQLYSLSTTTSTSLSNLNAAVANTGNVTNITNNVTQLMADALQWKKNTDGSGVYDASHGTTQAQKITNVAAGQLEDGSTDAVNASQLYQLSTSSATNFSSLSTVVSRAGDLTNINGSISTANSNIADLQSDALQWKKNTDGTGAYDASHGTTQAQKITNVAAGLVEDGSTDAVNASQLYQVSTSSASGITSLSTAALNTTGKLNTVSSNVSDLQSDALQWKNNTNGSGAYDASHGTNQAQKITNVAAGQLENGSTDAVNAGQLYQLSTSSSTSFSSLSTVVSRAGDLTNINGNISTANSNIAALQSNALQWKKNVNGNGGFYDASHGTSQAQKITNVAAGQLADGSTDAVNAGQLYQLSTSSATSFSSLSTVVSRAGDLTNINGNISTANSNITDLQSDALQWKNNTDGSGAYDASHGTSQAQKITNVANGDLTYNSTDAVNGSQLSTTNSNLSIVSSSVHKVNDTVNKLEKDSLQWVQEENGNSYYDASHGVTNARYRITNVANGSLAPDSSDVVNGSQLYTTNSSINAVSTSVNSVTAAVTRLQDNTLQWNGSAYDAGHGSTMAQKITRVAEADLAPDSTDAVNGSQLNQTNLRVGSLSSTVANLNDSLNKTNTRINSIAESTSRISDNLSSATDKINDLNQNALQINGENYDANYKKITNITGGKIEQGSNEAVTGGQLFTTNEKLNTVSSSVGNLTGRLNGAIDRLDTVSGATATLSTSLAEVNTSISTLRRDALSWNGNAYDASHGSGTAQKITNVANGTVSNSSTDAVNGSQLYNLSTSLSSSLSTVTAGNNTGLSTTNSNVSTLSSSLSSAVNNISNLQRDALQWNGNAYDASHGSGAAQKITNVANGTLSSGSTDAVNGDQLYNLSTSMINSLSTVTAGNNTSLSTTNSNVSTLSSSLSSAVNNISNLQRDALQWNGNAYDASHGSGAAQKITNVANGTLSSGSTDAVNGDQLYNLSTSLSNSLSTVTAGNNTGLSTTNSNVSTLSSSLNSAVNNISNLQRDALQWNGNAYDASHGSGAAQKITNVAAGQLADGSTDAVNAGQLYSISSSIISSVSSSVDQVVTESRTTIETMNKDIKAAQDDIKTAQDDIKTSKRLIDELQKNSVHFDDGTTAFSNQLTREASNERTISGVADGRVDATSNQAVNGRQLYSLSTSTSTSLSSLQDQLHLASGTIPAGISTTLSSLQLNALQWNGSAYDASHGSGTAQKITNVASGDTGQNSTEAVNGGQLWQLKNEWKQDLQSLSSSVDTKLAQNNGGGNASAINEATEKANQAISDTQKLSASTADALSAVAASLGGNASYNPLTRAGTGGFTAPSYTTSNADGTAVTANNVGDAINNLYNGGSKYAKVNSTQAVASASGSDAIAVGGAAAASGKAAVAIGSQATASAENGVAIGNHASVTQNGGIALGANSVANTAAGINGYIPVSATAQQARAIQATTSTQAAVSVGDAANGVYRQITGVAAGTADTDAVNVAQLKGVNARMENINRYVNDVNDRVHRVERRAYSGTALAMALSGAYLPQLNAGEQTVGVGMGSYHGYAAVGINYKATNNTGKFSWGAGVSTTGRETGFNAGIGYKW